MAIVRPRKSDAMRANVPNPIQDIETTLCPSAVIGTTTEESEGEDGYPDAQGKPIASYIDLSLSPVATLGTMCGGVVHRQLTAQNDIIASV